MKITHTVNPKISEDADGTECLLGLSDASEQTNLQGFGSSVNESRNLLLADGELTIPLDGITTIRGFWLKATGAFDLRINGGAAIRFNPGKVDADTSAATARVFMEANISTLHITPVADLRAHWAAWGDDL